MKSKNQSIRATKNNMKNSTQMQQTNSSISSKVVSIISTILPKYNNQLLLLEQCRFKIPGFDYDEGICAITLNGVGFLTESTKDRYFLVAFFNILSLTKFVLSQNDDESLYLETSDVQITVYSENLIHISRIIFRNYSLATMLIPNQVKLQFEVYDNSLFPTPPLPFSLSQAFQYRYSAISSQNRLEYNHSVVQYFHSLMKTHNPIFNFKHLPTTVQSDQIGSIISSLIDIPAIAGISCRNSDTPSILLDICPLIEQSKYIKSIKLMNCNVSEGINEIAEAFSVNTSIPLQQLYLNDNDFEDLNPLINSLASLETQLTHLSLTETGLNEESLELFGQSLLQAESLQHLTYLGIGGSEFSGDYVSNFVKYIQTNKNLTELDISGSKDFSSILAIISKSQITTLNLADCIFDDQSVQLLMNASQYISSLDLSGCNLNYMEISQLIPNLGKKQNSLVTLKINRLNFSSERSFAILRGFILSDLDKWKSIEMDETKITSNELLGYQAIFLKMKNLESLSFRSDFVEKDAKIVETLLDVPSLKSLRLSDSKLSSLVPSILKSNLTSIDLSSNEMNDNTALKLLSSTKLQKIKLNDNPFDDFDTIIEAANNNKNLTTAPIKNGLSYIPYNNELFSSAFNENIKDFHLYHHLAFNEDVKLPYPFSGNSHEEEIQIMEDTTIYDSEKINIITVEDPSPAEKVQNIPVFPELKQSSQRKRKAKQESGITKNVSFAEDQNNYSNSDASSSSSSSRRRRRKKHSSNTTNDEINEDNNDEFINQEKSSSRKSNKQLISFDEENNSSNSPEIKSSSRKRIEHINLDESEDSNSPEIKSSSKRRKQGNEFDAEEDDYNNSPEFKSSSRKRIEHINLDENEDSNSPEIKSSSKRKMHRNEFDENDNSIKSKSSSKKRSQRNEFDENEDYSSNPPEIKSSSKRRKPRNEFNDDDNDYHSSHKVKSTKKRMSINRFDDSDDDYSNSPEIRKSTKKTLSKKETIQDDEDENIEQQSQKESDEDSFDEEKKHSQRQINKYDFDYNSGSGSNDEEVTNQHDEVQNKEDDHSENENEEEDEEVEVKPKRQPTRKRSSNIRNIFDSTSASEIVNQPKPFLHNAPPLNEDEDASSASDIETFEKRMKSQRSSSQKENITNSRFDSSSGEANEENQYSEKEANEENQYSEKEENEENQYSEKEENEENQYSEKEENEENQYSDKEENQYSEKEHPEDHEEEEEVWVNMTSKTSVKSTVSTSSNSIPKRFTFSTDSSPIHPSAQTTASSASPSPPNKKQNKNSTNKEADQRNQTRFDSNEEDELEQNQFDSNEDEQNDIRNLIFSSENDKIKKKPAILHNEEEDEELLNIESVDGNLLNRNARTLITQQKIAVSSESENDYDIQNEQKPFIIDNNEEDDQELNNKKEKQPQKTQPKSSTNRQITPNKRQSKIPMPMNSRSPLNKNPRQPNDNSDNTTPKGKSLIPSPNAMKKTNDNLKIEQEEEQQEAEIRNPSKLKRKEINNSIPESHPTLSEEEFAFSKKVKMNKEKEKSPPKARLPKQILHEDYGLYSTETENPHDNNMIMNTFLSDLDDSFSSSSANPNQFVNIPEKKEKKKKVTISKQKKNQISGQETTSKDKTQFHPPLPPGCAPEESLDSVCDFLQLASNMFSIPKRRKEKQINPILLAFSPPLLEID